MDKPNLTDGIYVDETGFKLHIRRSYGMSQRRQRASITVAISRGRNIRVCTAMVVACLIYYRSIVPYYNKTEFVQFFGPMLTTKVPQAFESRGHRIYFLPTYSPQLNHIELLFSKWKSIIKSRMTVFEGNTLLATILEGSTQISQGRVRGLDLRINAFCINSVATGRFKLNFK
ncbi:hypothetical protein RF11_08062 [Thelohanellus kitauei]|uniref:Tc1-like transposase DDE domain-containing protein n=1 Tax=Thelohanellus kitauei TaxID=669202 RepID=A0A0C2MPD7_THEKT|nr:hypothetical protein RF11_08062 [Thelohanellus kitauei]